MFWNVFVISVCCKISHFHMPISAGIFLFFPIRGCCCCCYSRTRLGQGFCAEFSAICGIIGRARPWFEGTVPGKKRTGLFPESGESYFPLLEGIFFFSLKTKTGRKWGLHSEKTALCFSAGRARCQNGVGENIPHFSRQNIFRDKWQKHFSWHSTALLSFQSWLSNENSWEMFTILDRKISMHDYHRITANLDCTMKFLNWQTKAYRITYSNGTSKKRKSYTILRRKRWKTIAGKQRGSGIRSRKTGENKKKQKSS